MENKPLLVDQLLKNGRCCGNSCKNCPYVPKHIKGSIDTCTIDDNGNKHWKNSNNLWHREGDLPAIERADGTKYWYINGKWHRELGPAVITNNGTECWYLNGRRYIIPEQMPLHLFLNYCRWEYKKSNGS